MKWLRKNKAEILDGVQIVIILHTMLQGFWFDFLLAWSKSGLPMEWWAVVITLVLAALSLFVFFYWCIQRSKKEQINDKR